jgi:hypothetical protein
MTGTSVIRMLRRDGFRISLNFDTPHGYFVSQGDVQIASFYLDDLGHFSAGVVKGQDCIDWLTFHTELQEATRG